MHCHFFELTLVCVTDKTSADCSALVGQYQAYITKLLSCDCATVLMHITEHLLVRLNLRIGSTSVASAKSTRGSSFVQLSTFLLYKNDPFESRLHTRCETKV